MEEKSGIKKAVPGQVRVSYDVVPVASQAVWWSERGIKFCEYKCPNRHK